MEWTPEFSVEVKAIDKQHKKSFYNVRNFPPVSNWWLKANLHSDCEKFLSMLKNHPDAVNDNNIPPISDGGFLTKIMLL